MNLDKAIKITEEHMDTCEKDSEEYAVLQILLSCANICKQAVSEFS